MHCTNNYLFIFLQTFLGIVHENENNADGIQKILKFLHAYVPYKEKDDENVYGSQGVVGDQLSIERAINCHISLANGFTAEERLDGLHFEVADWHAGNKFLEVSYTINSTPQNSKPL